MATDESGFKTEFRKDLKACFGLDLFEWTNNDMYRHGLADFSCHYDGDFFPIEAKWASSLPKKDSSLVLKHEVSESQINFINGIRRTGGRGMGGVLIGIVDVAVVMKELKSNYTFAEVRAAPRFEKIKGVWQVSDFFKTLRSFYDGKR